MQAGVYGYLHWTPAVFWDMSMAEYAAAMKGVTTIETTKTEALQDAKNPGKLKKSDVDDLQRLLKEKG